MLTRLCLFLAAATLAHAEPSETLPIYDGLAPGETSDATGTLLPPREQPRGDFPPIERVENVRRPTLDVYPAANPNGVGVVILPGGGFKYVVPNLEGSEAAAILNRLGITAFVLRYRTKADADDAGWPNALDDARRAMQLVRDDAARFKLQPDQIRLLGFSAGGQVAARLIADGNSSGDAPAFAVLVYPWNLYDAKRDALLSDVVVTERTPPTFLVHTHDDRSSSLGAALLYADLKRAGVDAELHIYRSGGHGYGTRPRAGSAIGTWPDRMTDWMQLRGLVETDPTPAP